MSDEVYRKIFSRNLSYYMEKSGKTQADLINDLNINKSAISTWVNATRLPRMDKVQLLADYFGINKSDLLEEKQSSAPSTTKGVRIPVVGRVAAGIPICAEEEIIDFEDIPIELAKRGEFFGLRIRGDSMSPTIPDKSNVIVRKQDDAETGDIVIALVNGHDGVCKRLKKMDYGIMLISINPAYDPLVFTHKELDNLPVQIVGKVVEVRIKL